MKIKKQKPKSLYEVKKVGNAYRVWSTKLKKFITKDCPEEIAKETCSDFERMENRDYRPIGLPDFSKTHPKDKPN